MPTLNAVLGRYPNTTPLLDGTVADPNLGLRFANVKPANRAFAPMVRELRYDVCELAIATFLQAKAFGKDIVLLPIVVAARFQETALLCLKNGPIQGPEDLVGRRVGTRGYSQTTGFWLRGILKERYGIAPDAIRWVTFEDAHVAEVRDPPFAERAPAGADLLAMLHAGELDAIVVGNDVPDDPALKTVFADPAAAAAAFEAQHGFVPVNHLVTVRGAILRERPQLAGMLMDLFSRAKAASGSARPDLLDSQTALEPVLTLALRYADEQGMLPRPMTVAEVWAGLPEGVA